MTVTELKLAIKKLPPGDYNQLISWIDEYENSKWDMEIEQDQKSGKLDKLINQALQDFENGNVERL